jgi:hypothetical protein
MVTRLEQPLNLIASDISGQRRFRLKAVPHDLSVGELIDSVRSRMKLDPDESGEEVQIEARVNRLGRHLHRAELVGDVLQNDDQLTIHPKVMAG